MRLSLSALVLLACVQERSDLEQREQAIYHGSRSPQVIELSEGQRLAIGWLFDANLGSEASFCTGTLIASGVVITAGHCIEDKSPSSLGFGLGLMPETPRSIFQVLHVQDHPREDVALLLLEGEMPLELRPIPAATEPPPEALLGQEVEVAGFGQTHDGSEGRYFARVELVSLTESMLEVNGRGQQGLCFGDSGGPVMAEIGGRVLVMGVEHGGDDNCVGHDQLSRLDPLEAWISEVIGGGSPTACADLSYQGRCEGEIAVWCGEDDLPVQKDCALDGQTCGYIDENLGYYCETDERCESAHCDGTWAVRCEEGSLSREHCSGGCELQGAEVHCQRISDAGLLEVEESFQQKVLFTGDCAQGHKGGGQLLAFLSLLGLLLKWRRAC